MKTKFKKMTVSEKLGETLWLDGNYDINNAREYMEGIEELTDDMYKEALDYANKLDEALIKYKHKSMYEESMHSEYLDNLER